MTAPRSVRILHVGVSATHDNDRDIAIALAADWCLHAEEDGNGNGVAACAPCVAAADEFLNRVLAHHGGMA